MLLRMYVFHIVDGLRGRQPSRIKSFILHGHVFRVSFPRPPLVRPSFNIAKLLGGVVLDHCGVHDGIDLACVVLHGVLSCSPLARGE